MPKRNSFAKRLLKIWVNDTEIEEANDSLIDGFLEFGSETRDNLRCIDNIEYGVCNRTRGPKKMKGLKIKDTDLLVSDIIWYLEDDRIYEFLTRQFPELSQEQIEGSLRMATMVLSSLDKEDNSD